MALTSDGARLTAAHRRAQLALRAQVLAEMTIIWRAFNIADIAGTWPSIEAALVPLIRIRGQHSAGLAAAYYREFRAAEGVTGALAVDLADPPSSASIAGSLRIVGPRRAGQLVQRGATDAASKTFTSVAGAVGREALLPGRETILRTLKRDRRAHGYQRVTSGNACAYCTSQAGVIQTNETTFPAHDHCACTAEPAFRAPAGARTVVQGGGADLGPAPDEIPAVPVVTGNPVADLEALVARLAGR